MDRIERAEVFVHSPSRNFVTIKLTTSDGIIGWGDATVNGRELAVATYLRDHLLPLLIGRDPSAIEDTWQYLYRGVYWRRGPINMASIGGIDLALWDILGKRANMPLYQMLGGRVRSSVLAYRHAFGWTVPELLEAVDAQLEAGYTAVRVQAGVPGLRTVYGVSREKVYEPAGRAALPHEEEWDSGAYLTTVPQVIEQVRAHVGDGVKLLHDAHHRLTPTEAALLGKRLEPYNLFWLEDVTPAEDQAALRWVRQHTVVPLAIGEVFNSWWDAQTLIEERLVDYIRCAVVHTGGISHMRKLLAAAELHGVKAGPHGPSDISPIAFAASVHMMTACHNFGIQEYMGYPAPVDDVFHHAWQASHGSLQPGEEPGLGVDVDETSFDLHPYRTAYLPVARKLDGTLTDW